MKITKKIEYKDYRAVFHFYDGIFTGRVSKLVGDLTRFLPDIDCMVDELDADGRLKFTMQASSKAIADSEADEYLAAIQEGVEFLHILNSTDWREVPEFKGRIVCYYRNVCEVYDKKPCDSCKTFRHR